MSIGILQRPSSAIPHEPTDFPESPSTFMPRRMLASLVPAIAALMYGAAPYPASAGTLPSNGSFVAGSRSISTSGSTMTIGQTSSRGVIDWSHFSIGRDSHVAFENGNGATLNRVTGGDPSLIFSVRCRPRAASI